MSAYDEYLKMRERAVEVRADKIAIAKRDEIPQHILWDKECTAALSDDAAKCDRINGVFYFTERLVNRLMYLAYLQGCVDINKRSHEQGWADCMAHVRKQLGIQEGNQE